MAEEQVNNKTENGKKEILEREWMQSLICHAMEAQKSAYAPYSKFQVGAALLTVQGKTYTGCNIENASYGATVCAERVAFFQAVREGERAFRAIAIVGGEDYAYPCGICRQVMGEFCGNDFQIIVAKDREDYKVYSLGELLPHGFGPGQLGADR